MSGFERIQFDGDVNYLAIFKDGTFVTPLNDPAPIVDLGSERPERLVRMRTSTDGGRSWSEPAPAFAYPAGPGFAMPVAAVMDLCNRLHVFGLRFLGVGRDELPWKSLVLHTYSDDRGRTWSNTRSIDFGHDYTGSLNNVIVLDSGRIVLPLSYLDERRASGQFVSMTVFSDDRGETWGRSNDCAVEGGGKFLESGAAEPVVVQLNSGLLRMLIRTTTGYFWDAFSVDGAIWTSPQPTRIVSSNAPAGVVRLRGGEIVLAWNNLYGEPMRENGISYARQKLHMAISRDDGQTWSVPKTIASVEPDDLPNAQTTYPYLFEARDGAIVAVYHRVNAREGRGWHHPIREVIRIDPAWLRGDER